MPRYQLTEYEDATPGVKAVYDDFLRTTGSFSLPNWIKSQGRSERIIRAYWEKAKGTLVLGELPRILKELIVFVVSVANGSQYCSASHAHAVLQLDKTLSYQDMALMTQDLDAVDLPPAHRAALKFADKTARNADLVTDDDFAALAQAGFTPDNIAEILGVIDLAMMFNCYTKTIRLPLDPEYRPVLPELN